MMLKKQDHFNKAAVDQLIAGYSQQWLPYVQFAFNTGVKRSYSEVRASVSRSEFQTRQSEFLTLMSGAINAQTKDLADRVYTELGNVSADVYTRIRRVRADGNSAGWSQQQIRREIKKQIDIGFNRVKTIVQTEITRSHAQGQLAAFDRLGVQHIGVLVEWTNPNDGLSAAGNPSPCKVCKPLLNVVLTPAEARGLIPRHPNCMCSFKAVTDRTPQQVRQKREIERAIKRSVKAEGRKQTKWSGAKRKIARRK
jgi:hypothetical protein